MTPAGTTNVVAPIQSHSCEKRSSPRSAPYTVSATSDAVPPEVGMFNT